jgi:hypothetical protein
MKKVAVNYYQVPNRPPYKAWVKVSDEDYDFIINFIDAISAEPDVNGFIVYLKYDASIDTLEPCEHIEIGMDIEDCISRGINIIKQRSVRYHMSTTTTVMNVDNKMMPYDFSVN